jgi:hypothetical protein
MPRPPVRKPGYYPDKRENETVTKTKLQIGKKNILLITYESERAINIYVGGPEKWCIHCELIKRENQVQPLGYLIKLRYDMLCSLEHNFAKGHDIKQILYILSRYIYDKYPNVKELSFNDLSTRQCDNENDVNLAVMTFLYAGKTWYEKNFNAYIASHNKSEMEKIKRKYSEAKSIPWEEMKETVRNNPYSGMTDDEMGELYMNTETWKEFFETIYDKIEIADFCMFISTWVDAFIQKYFNNLQGLTYIMPIVRYNIDYKESNYVNVGGRRYTRKATRKVAKDYK